MFKSGIILAMLWSFLVSAVAQGPSPLEVVQALDQECRQLKNAEEDVRRPAVRKLLARIRQQPPQFEVALAWNAAVDHADGSDRDTLQEIADTLAKALRDAPEKQRTPSAYRTLAELARYDQVSVSLDDSRYSAAMRDLEPEDEQRRNAEFSLADLNGNKWTLQALRGKVVLINFWATWCPPCRQEIPILKSIYDRFKDHGLIVLAISEEDPATLRKFVAENDVEFPVLVDAGAEVQKNAYHTVGVPVSFIYDRSGRIVAQALSMPTMDRMLEKLERAGLR
jgi:peroxiredoxin